jgi:hypothetical protein
MVEEPTQDLDVPSEAIREEDQEDFEKQEDRDNHDDHENEEEQPTIILFTPEQLEVLLKMNRFDFIELVVAFKGGSSKGVEFKPTELGNLDGVQNWKVVDVWLVEMENYFHATKVGQHSTVEFA